jgi:hypothetical protein
MRRIAVAIAAVLAAAALAGGSAAAVGEGSVAGSGFVDTTFEGIPVAFQIIVSAQGGPTGATGHVTMVFDHTRYNASVDCIVVVGNSALVVGTLDEPVGTANRLIVEVVDNGQGHKSPPDATVGGTAEPTPFDPCFPSFINFGDAFPVEHGNFVVKSSGL